MKVSHLTLSSILLSILPQQSASLKCGIRGITQPCIGDTDIRYNPDVSYDIKEQDNFWELFEGLYMADDECFTSEDGTDVENYVLPGTEGLGVGTFDGCGFKSFLNVTFDGPRYFWKNYRIMKHNGDAPGGFEVPGIALPIDFYGVSTFEKNGQILQLGTVGQYPDTLTFSDENLAMLTPVGGRAYMVLIEESMDQSVPIFMYETSFCTDSDCNSINKYTETFLPRTDDGVRKIDTYQRASYTKVDKKTWMEGISEAYVEYNIPPPDAPSPIPGFDSGIFVQPFDPTTSDSAPECHSGICPTEEDWKVRDPTLGTSPYVEPEGVLTDGFIAGVTIATIAVALIIFYFIYKRGVDNRERRVKEAVLKSISKTMTLRTRTDLSPKNLAEMFQKIDVDGNGTLDKSEMKGLVDEAGVANMSDRDYDVLFASIDIDSNGTLDFTEFCAFFASISVVKDLSISIVGQGQQKDTFEEA